MLEFKTVFIIVLLIAVIYLIIKLYTYNTLIVDNSKKIILKSIEEHYEDYNDRLDNLEELLNNKLDNYSKKLSDIYSYQNKILEINKMSEQKVVRKFNIYDENLINDDNNNIFNSVENDKENENNNVNNNVKKNVFIRINNDLFMSPNNLKISNTSKTTSIEEDNKAQKDSTTSKISDSTSIIYEIKEENENSYKKNDKVIILENDE